MYQSYVQLHYCCLVLVRVSRNSSSFTFMIAIFMPYEFYCQTTEPLSSFSSEIKKNSNNSHCIVAFYSIKCVLTSCKISCVHRRVRGLQMQ